MKVATSHSWLARKKTTKKASLPLYQKTFHDSDVTQAWECRNRTRGDGVKSKGGGFRLPRMVGAPSQAGQGSHLLSSPSQVPGTQLSSL